MSQRLTRAFIKLHATNCVERGNVIKTLTLAVIIRQVLQTTALCSLTFMYMHSQKLCCQLMPIGPCWTGVLQPCNANSFGNICVLKITLCDLNSFPFFKHGLASLTNFVLKSASLEYVQKQSIDSFLLLLC